MPATLEDLQKLVAQLEGEKRELTRQRDEYRAKWESVPWTELGGSLRALANFFNGQNRAAPGALLTAVDWWNDHRPMQREVRPQ
jgi:hypothetical protein